MTDSPPPTESLTRTNRARSWVIPTVVVVAVLLAVVVAGKLGQSSSTPTPAPAVADRTPVVPGRSLFVVSHPIRASSGDLMGPQISIRTDGESYVDGIPSVIDGNQVVRVRDAASVPVGSNVLVGGWVQGAICAKLGLGACPALLSDTPAASPRVATLLLSGQANYNFGSGPRVYLATVQNDPTCAYSFHESCLPQLTVGDPVWEGDDATTATPVGPVPLMRDLAGQFPDLDFRPFEESSYCPVEWPVQSYATSESTVPRAEWPGLPVRLVVIYPSAAALAADAPHNRAAAAEMSAFDASNRCVSIPGGVNDKAWIVRDNVMVLLGGDASAAAQVRDALSREEP